MVGSVRVLRMGVAAAAMAVLMGGVAARAAEWDGGMPTVSRVQYPDPRYPERPDGPRYGDPRSGDPRYGDPRSGDPRYGDPRNGDPRNGERREGRGGGPGGSYQQSCRDARQEGPTLTAVCSNGRGREMQTSLDVSRCGRSDIANNGGVLQCGGVRGR